MATPRPRRASLPDPATIQRPWLGAYPPGVPPTYRYPQVPLARFLDDAARDFPDRIGTWTDGATLSWSELRDRADRFAAALCGLGAGRGDHLAIVLPNLPATVIAVAAASRIGAVVVPLDPDLAEEELGRRLAATACRFAVTTTRTLPRLLAARAAAGGLEAVIVTRSRDWRPRGRVARLTRPGRRRARSHAEEGVITWDEAISGVTHRVPQAPVTGDEPAVIHHTAGSTGPARAVVLTNAAVVANVFQARLWVPDVRAGNERLLAAVPFTRPGGFTLGLLSGLLSAATLVLVPRFDAGEVLGTIEAARPTLLPATPGMVESLLAHRAVEDVDLRSVRAGVCGGRSLDPTLVTRFERLTRGGRLRAGYGVTEAGPLTHANPIYGRSEPGSVGLPVSDTVACVVDPSEPSRLVPPGETGLLLVSGPQLMRGYLRDPAATAAVLRDGWLVTGDLARVDAGGFFTIEGRAEPTVRTEPADAADADPARVDEDVA